MPTKEIRTLRLERERIHGRHTAGAPGTLVVHQLSDALDAAVTGVWDRLPGTEGAALLALGEYGRRELSPASSLDLLVLRPAHADPSDAAKALSYELWGAELDLAYAVYTPEEALRLARTRVDSELRFLDARLLAGDEAMFAAWWAELLAFSRSSTDAFLDRLRAVVRSRRSSTDDVCSCLEPDLMDGDGGLADLATIGWISTVRGPQTLPAGVGGLARAADFLHRIRNELHYLTGRSTDVFQMQYQLPVAEALARGRPDGAVEIDVLRDLYERGRTIAFTLDSLLLEEGDPDVVRAAAGVFEGGEIPQDRWPDRARERFVALLSSGGEGRAGFRALEQTGVLARALPEWEGIRCLPQRSVYHRHAVDVHSFEVVAALTELADSDDELTRQVAHEVATEGAPWEAPAGGDQETLLLAGLLHDIGKGSDEDHCIRGETLARSVMERMGVGEPQASDVTWLVRNHLLLSRVATRRDIGDESLTAELAGRIGTERRLRLLYLLTIADARATGAAAWSTWKATLIARLYARVGHVLRRGDPPADWAGGTHGKAEALKRALPDYPEGTIEEHVALMPRDWLVTQSLRGLVDQTRQILAFHRSDALQVQASPDPDAGIWELTVVANDRPGLFSRMAGVLALHALNVVGAEAYTREDGIALAVFRLGASGDQPGPGAAAETPGSIPVAAITDDARRALHGRLSLDARLAELHSAAASPPAGARADVEIDDGASERFTVIDVRAPDRIGLLYTITRALVDMDLDIHVAKVATYDDGVVDVFYVCDVEGRKIADPEYGGEIVRAIRHRLNS